MEKMSTLEREMYLTKIIRVLYAFDTHCTYILLSTVNHIRNAECIKTK